MEPDFDITLVAKTMKNHLILSTTRFNVTGIRFRRPPSVKISAPSSALAHWRSRHHILE
jgi:hypothetical protein